MGRCYAGTPAQLARSEPPAPSNDTPKSHAVSDAQPDADADADHG